MFRLTLIYESSTAYHQPIDTYADTNHSLQSLSFDRLHCYSLCVKRPYGVHLQASQGTERESHTRNPSHLLIISVIITLASCKFHEDRRRALSIIGRLSTLIMTFCMVRSMFRLPPRLRRQLEAHVLVYAEMLLKWELPQQRAELLEAARLDMALAPELSNPVIVNTLKSTPLGQCHLFRFCSHAEGVC